MASTWAWCAASLQDQREQALGANSYFVAACMECAAWVQDDERHRLWENSYAAGAVDAFFMPGRRVPEGAASTSAKKQENREKMRYQNKCETGQRRSCGVS